MVRYWYRTSPRPLVPVNPGNFVSPTDPPFLINGMTRVLVDSKGRLLRFEAMPPQVESPATRARPVDWKPLFAAAAIDPAAFTEIASTRTPPSFADERKAWTGTLPETNVTVTIEAAGYRGRPIMFDIVAPWSVASREPDAKLALDYFVYRASRELGSLAAALGGLDAIVFTAGIGENSAVLRERVCHDARWLGVELNPAANVAGGPRISSAKSRVSVWAIPTNEELMIARHARRLIPA